MRISGSSDSSDVSIVYLKIGNLPFDTGTFQERITRLGAVTPVRDKGDVGIVGVIPVNTTGTDDPIIFVLSTENEYVVLSRRSLNAAFLNAPVLLATAFPEESNTLTVYDSIGVPPSVEGILHNKLADLTPIDRIIFDGADGIDKNTIEI